MEEVLGKLPRSVKARISALKANQLKALEIEARFYQKVHALEKEFEGEFASLFEDRCKLVTGAREPSEEEKKQPILFGLSAEELQSLDEKSDPENGEKGIPSFWLTVLKNSDLGDNITPSDTPILENLVDITSTVESNPTGFTLYFHFKENEFFNNKVLKKVYEMKMTPDAEDPFDYEGPTIVKCTGDVIEWKDGKDVTKKVVKKKQKKGNNAGKFITKTVSTDSFFNFFSPPEKTECDEDEEDECHVEELLQQDYEFGQTIRDVIVPRAVLYFTGEQTPDYGLDDDFPEDDDEDDDEDDE